LSLREGGILLDPLASDIDIPLLEPEFNPSGEEPVIFFPFTVELLSPPVFPFLITVFFLLRVESDDEQEEGMISDILLHLRFLNPYLLLETACFT
jgi:hypothetical protein